MAFAEKFVCEADGCDYECDTYEEMMTHIASNLTHVMVKKFKNIT